MRNLIAIVFILVYSFVYGQVNKYGLPLYKNYDPLLYNASEQNWAVVQDDRGVMYFGNNDNGVLEYDGVNWEKIKIPNESIVYSLQKDDKGTVFVGAVDEFGYLAPDINGSMKYISLSSKFDTSDQNCGKIYKIYPTGDYVYFCSVSAIYRYDYKNVVKYKDLPEASFLTFYHNNTLYVGNFVKGLLKVNEQADTLSYAPGGDFFKYKNILTVLNYNKTKMLIGTFSSGIFIYDPVSGSVTDTTISEDLTNYVINNNVYCADVMDDNYVIGTISNGIAIMDNYGNLTNFFNSNYGLIHDRVYSVYNPIDEVYKKPLWLALDKGIAKIYYNSPIRYFSESSGLKGGVIDIIRFNNILYVATVYGVYYMDFENNVPVFKLIEEIPPPWKLAVYVPDSDHEMLMVGTAEGIFTVDKNNKVHSVEANISNLQQELYRFYTFTICPSRHHNNIVYFGTNKGLLILKYNNTNWEIIKNIEDINAEVRSIAEDEEGNVWLAASFNGLYNVVFKGDGYELKHYGIEQGLPSLNFNSVYYLDNELLVAAKYGFYKYNKKKDGFYYDESFGDSFDSKDKAVSLVVKDKHGNYWIAASNNDQTVGKKWMEIISKFDDGKIQIIDQPFKPLPNLVIEAIYNDDDNITWIGNSNGLYSYNGNYNRNFNEVFYPLIRKVTINDDSVLFFGTFYKYGQDSSIIITRNQTDIFKPILNYSDRNIKIYFSAPYFDEENTIEYSYILEGLNESWSSWSKTASASFTNIPEGDYVFKVKARNIYGVESKIADYSFSVLPPWYRTIWAYIAYVIIGIFALWLFITLYTRKLKNDKIRLEKIVAERTAEVVAQKEEIEKQKNKIAEINEELTDSIKYAKRIQRAILPHEEYAESVLNEHFILFKPKDIVSGDFYWLTKIDHFTIVTAADCTGHGVPGAFMSMLGVAFLNEIVKNKNVRSTGQVLDHLRQHIIVSLQQTGKPGEQKDGMDISLCAIDNSNNTLQFSGANNPLYLIRKKSFGDKLAYKAGEENVEIEPSIDYEEYNLFELKGDKMPVAIHIIMEPFTTNELELKPGDTIYMFSDGFADQFGGKKGKKFMYKPFKKLLLQMQNESMNTQREKLDKAIEDWKAFSNPYTNEPYEQIDDIVVVGVRFLF
ncbi:MAG: hypothetical protein Kow0068_11930 [Marinilabiliales bacterium]